MAPIFFWFTLWNPAFSQVATLENLRCFCHPEKNRVDFTGYLPFKSLPREQIKRVSTTTRGGGAYYAHPLALPHLKISCGYAPTLRFHNKGLKIEFKMSRFQTFYDAKWRYMNFHFKVSTLKELGKRNKSCFVLSTYPVRCLYWCFWLQHIEQF